MSVENVFAKLGGGIRFNQNANKEAVDVFKRGWSTDMLTSKLDFFGNNTKQIQAEPAEEAGTTAKSVVWEQKIKVKGGTAPPPLTQWADLSKIKAREFLIKNINSMGYQRPSPVQSQVIPAMIANHEVLCAAPTGSGKTASYLIPIVQILDKPDKHAGPRALIIIPTRELAVQVDAEAKRIITNRPFRVCLLTAMSGKALNTKDDSGIAIKHADIIITTPSRLLSLIKSGGVNLHSVASLILDEADKLLDGTFLEQIDSVITSCSNPKLIVSMFSATFLPAIEELAETVMKAPLRISVGKKNAAVGNVVQKLVYCGDERGKLIALHDRIKAGIKPPVLLFVQTKERAQALFRELVYEDLNVDLITSDRTPAQRERTVEQFRKGKIWFLIATDLMARGLDFKGVNLVINYDMPSNANDYIHRVGRTGRMGREGVAITLYTDEDLEILRKIVNVMKNSGQEVPPWLQDFQATKKLVARISRLNQEATNPVLAPAPQHTGNKGQRKGKGKRQRDDEEGKEDNRAILEKARPTKKRKTTTKTDTKTDTKTTKPKKKPNNKKRRSNK